MIRIGYQGVENSNNYYAAKKMAARFGESRVILIPLISSGNVVTALAEGSIDYGVMAVSTDLSGEVAETIQACRGYKLTVTDRVSMDIHHCLFKKSVNVENGDIRRVASHPEALRECRKQIRQLFPEAELFFVEDTALSARQLAQGILSNDSAVLCSREAGQKNGLCLIQANVEDLEHNGTTFAMMELNRRA